METLGTLGLLVVCWIAFKVWRTSVRREKLMQKYGDTEIVRKIMKQTIWEGETEEMLKDSLGRPAAIDQKVLKTKIKETWKYGQTGKNQFKVRVIVENHEVVGWKVRD